MAGSYAKIFNKIWADPDFRSLTRGQQWLFFALISQPELNFAGVVTTTDRRLTGCADGFTLEELHDDLAVLEERRYVVVDQEHDEILVRSYIRHDGAWRTPNVLTSILRDVSMVRSQAIRSTLAEELSRLEVEELSGKKADEMRDNLARVIETLRPRVPVTVGARVSGTLRSYVSEPIREPIAEPTVVVAVVGEVVKDRTSVTLPHDPSPPPESESGGVLIALAIAKPKFECGSDDDPHFVAFWKAYPNKRGKPSARTAWKNAVKRAAARGLKPEDLAAASAEYRADPERTREKRYVPHASRWLNDDRWDASEEDDDQTAGDAPEDPNERYWLASAAAERAPGEHNHGR